MANPHKTKREEISLETRDTPESGSTLRADAAANRGLILATAESLFAERGVADVTMADIAEAANVGKGTLYRRFANKAELSLALMDNWMTEFQEQTLEQLRAWTGQRVPYLEQLDRFLEALVYFTDAHAPLLCEVERAGLLQQETNQSLPYYWEYLTVRGLLRAAAREGEIAADLDLDYLADALLAPLQIDVFRFQRQVKGFSLERISAGLQSLLRALSHHP